jgi:hypothetical protein
MHFHARCVVCGKGRRRSVQEDGSIARCPCGGQMVKSDRWVDRRIAKAKADLQCFGPFPDTRMHAMK